ncbi:unnamed protein product, partial [Medioppia subpectinata]
MASHDQSFDQMSMRDTLESALIRASHATDVNQLLEEFGVIISGRLKGQSYGEQAVCAPELRAVELESPEGNQNSIFFPKCVRIKRCGGCCGPSRLLECTPTKKSYKIIKRAHIRIRRSVDGRAVPNLSQHSTNVEEHEECRCECRVKQTDCDPYIHKYRPELCKCECLNTKDQMECRLNNAYRVWDSSECRCKCIHTKLCSTGLHFDDHTCRVECVQRVVALKRAFITCRCDIICDPRVVVRDDRVYRYVGNGSALKIRLNPTFPSEDHIQDIASNHLSPDIPTSDEPE